MYWGTLLVNHTIYASLTVGLHSQTLSVTELQTATVWSYLAPFLRYGDLLAKNCLFFIPCSHSASPLPMFHLEFRAEETRLSYRLHWRPHAGVILTWYRTMTDVRTDRRTESIIS